MSNINSTAVYGNISNDSTIYDIGTGIIKIYAAALVVGRISDNGTIGYGCRTGIADINSAALAIIAVTGGNVVDDNAMGYGWRAVSDVNTAALITDAPIGNGKAGYKSIF